MISLRTVKEYCKDYTKIENYDKAIADTENTWDCHHKLHTVGKSLSEEHKRKISEANKGQIPWNKGKRLVLGADGKRHWI